MAIFYDSDGLVLLDWEIKSQPTWLQEGIAELLLDAPTPLKVDYIKNNGEQLGEEGIDVTQGAWNDGVYTPSRWDRSVRKRMNWVRL